MKTILTLAMILSVGAPAAFAQEPQVGSLRLLSTTSAPPPAAKPPTAPVETPVAAPVVAVPAVEPAAAIAPAPVASPAIIATGWTGPVNYSPAGVVDLISRVCRPATTGDGGDVIARAEELGIGGPVEAPADISRALPPGTVTWKVPSLDGELYLFGYGEHPLKCGAVVARPMPEVGFGKVIDAMQEPGQGFVIDSGPVLTGDVRWVRLRSPQREFIDLMEYPYSGDRPGVLRADFLPE